MKWLYFFLRHSMLVGCGAVALCYQTGVFLHFFPGKFFLAFIFCGTIFLYNAYYLFSEIMLSAKPVQEVFKKNIFKFILLTTAGAITLLFIARQPGLLGPAVIVALLVLVYSYPLWARLIHKRSKPQLFAKSFWLALTWSYATVALPAMQHAIGCKQFAVFFAARFSFMLLIAFIFETRDATAMQDGDDITGMAIRKRIWLMVLLWLAYNLCGVLSAGYDKPIAFAWVLTGMVTMLVYLLALQKRGYYFYYLLADGLMLFSAFATFVAANS